MNDQHISTLAQVLAASQLPRNGQGSEPSDSLKTEPTLPESSHTAGRESPTMEICETPLLFPATCLPAATLASRFLISDQNLAREMIAISGRQCSTRLDGTSPIGAFSK